VEKYATVGQVTHDNIVKRMRFECWVTKATRAHTHTHAHKHSEHVILIAFSRQQWLRERVSLLRYTYFFHVGTYIELHNVVFFNKQLFCEYTI
jgi:hypothetical protein